MDSGETVSSGSKNDTFHAIGTPTQYLPPIADAGPDQTVVEGDVVLFNGTGSYVPDRTIDLYEWDFDVDVDSDEDGNSSNDIDAAGPAAAHVYGDDGVYKVKLTVGSSVKGGDVMKVAQDCIFCMDSSSSMLWNDPNYLRIPAAQYYVDTMTPDDMGAVVDFDYDARLMPLTNKDGDHLSMDYNKIKNNLALIDSMGSTDISSGLNLSNRELKEFGDPTHLPVIILLTDAQNTAPIDDWYCRREANISADSAIIIFTIGLLINGSTEEQLLMEIADTTGGKYFSSQDPSNLREIYEEISTIVENMTTEILYASDYMAVTVKNAAPVTEPLESMASNEGLQMSVTAYTVDPGSDDLFFTWNWGDGTSNFSTSFFNGIWHPEPEYDPSVNGIKSPGGWYPFKNAHSMSHTYGDDGVYDITLTVKDDDGGVSTYSTTVTVYNVAPTVEPIHMQVGAGKPLNLTEEWVARYSGPGHEDDSAQDLVIDSLGDIYVTGYEYDHGTGYDYATIKYDTDGNELWVSRYNGPSNGEDKAKAVLVDSDHCVYVTGTSYGGPPQSGGTDHDMVTIKYDASGNELWISRYNGAGNSIDTVEAMVSDPSGNIVVAGSCIGGGAQYDIVLIKYDTSGNELWVTTYDSQYHLDDCITALTTDSLGNILVAGYSYGDGTNKDFITIKYDSFGNMVWERRYDGPAGYEDSASDIVADPLGNIYVTGYCYGYNSRHDYCTIKYDSMGMQLWMRRYMGADNVRDYANAIALDSFQNVYVAGRSFNRQSLFDYCTIKYDTNGYQLWVESYNGEKNIDDNPVDIYVDSFQNVYVTGESFEEGYSYDYTTVVYDVNGTQLMVKGYDGEAFGDDHVQAMEIDDFGNIYITGMSHQERFDDFDFVTVKYSFSLDFECDEGSFTMLSGYAIEPGSDDLTFTWNWGDGTSDTVRQYYADDASPEPEYDPTTNVIKSPWGPYPLNTTDTANHTYGDDGAYIVTLFVMDDDGGETRFTTTVTVNNVAPTINSFTATSGIEGSPVTFSSSASDPGSDDLTFTWDWGDGTNHTIVTYHNNGVGRDPFPSPLGTSPFAVTDTAEHTFGDDGVYTITLTVEDDDGGEITFTSTVTVENINPVIEPFGPFIINEGSSFDITGIGTDPGSDDLTFQWNIEGKPMISTIHYNDGTGTDPYPSPWGTCPYSVTETMSHTYTDNGNFSVTLFITDDDGGQSLYETYILVNNVPPSIISFEYEIVMINEPRTIGYWGHQCGVEEPYGEHTGILREWIDNISNQSQVFSGMSSVEDVQDIVLFGDASDMAVMAKRQLLGVWLNVVSGKLHLTTEVDMSNLNTSKTVWEAILEIEDVILNSENRTEMERVKDIADNINNGIGIAWGVVEFAASATDPGADDLTFLWDFGDGQWFENFHPNPGGEFPFTVTDYVEHSFFSKGTFAVTLTISDDDGDTSVTTQIIML